MNEFDKQFQQARDLMTKSMGELSEKLTSYDNKLANIQKQVDVIDLNSQSHNRIVGAMTCETLVDRLNGIDSFQRLIADRRGRAVLNLAGKDLSLIERKTTITETGQGFMQTGVVPIERIPAIVAEARQALTVRDVLTANPTTMAVVDFVRVQTPMSIASPVPEASLKPENQLQFVSVSEKIRTIATWVPASKQILDDMSELANFLNTSIRYYVDLAEEYQLLGGDGTGENLHGLIPQASMFDPASLPANSTRIDAVGAAIAKVQSAKELPPTFCILHPQDWWGMRLLKDSFGRYILGDPQTVVTPSLFGLTVIPTTSIAIGSFLIGSGNPTASEIRDRMELVVEVSTEHQDFFVKNLVAVRAEKRLALVVKRPNSYVTGSFAGLKSIQSPSS
jgi:HK97 family phage major capsid protein